MAKACNRKDCPLEHLQKTEGYCSKCGENVEDIRQPSKVNYKMAGLGLALMTLLGYGIHKWLSKGDTLNVPKMETLVHLSGSTTIGSHLAPALATDFLRKELNINEIATVKKDSLTIVYGKKSDGKYVGINIMSAGTSAGFTDLKSETADIGMASRPINSKEINLLAPFGKMNDAAHETVLGNDGIAIIVHPNNPLSVIQIEDVAKIYSGGVTEWKNLGANMGEISKPNFVEPSKSESDVKVTSEKPKKERLTPSNEPKVATGKIVPFARDEKSGTGEFFKNKLMKNKFISDGVKRAETNDMIAFEVSQNPDAIGFVSMESFKKLNVKVKILALKTSKDAAAVPFSPNTIANEDYYLSRRLYLYTGKTNSEWTNKFIAYTKSDAGQKIVQETGFVGTVSTDGPVEPTLYAGITYPEAYRDLTKGLKTMPYHIRFEKNSDILDTKALEDAKRAINYFKSKGKRPLLIGFADSDGEDDYNVELSKRRAEAVINAFKESSIESDAPQGFGKAIPIGDNSTDEGKSQNRRVEIWVKTK
jgi:phosphate transport system substrate-binding protein